MKLGLAVGDELGEIDGDIDFVGELDGNAVSVGVRVGEADGAALGAAQIPQVIRQFALDST